MTFPLLLIVAIYFKNFIVFESFASSNMIGNNLASFTSFVSSKTKNEAIAYHKLSKFYEVGIWANDLNAYKPYLRDTIIPEKFKNVGVLTFPTSGVQISHHHYFKHEILAALYKDGKYLIFQEPISIFKGLVWGAYVYFMPQRDYIAHIENVKKIYA